MKKAFYILFSLLLLSSCEVSYRDDRAFEPAKIAAVKINDVLYTIVNTGDNVAKVVLNPGVNLTALKTELLVANGELVNFENGVPHNLTKPIDIQISGEDGASSTWKLVVQSPPLLVSLDVVGLSLTKDKINFGKTTIIVQVPLGTDVTKLVASYGFLNGSMTNFVNGTAMDYTISPSKPPFKLQVLGADGATTYGYDVVYTSDAVGPAQIKGMVINGDTTSEMITVDAAKNIVQPVVPFLTAFSDATIQLITAFGNTVDPSFKTTNVDFLKSIKVKITGTNGVETEFTILNPLINSTPILERSHTFFNFAANAGSSAGWSGNNIVIASHSMNTGAIPVLGINAYDLSGNFLNSLDKTGTNFDGGAVTGIRKLATDNDGKILGVQLGAGAGATTTLSILRWNSITDPAPTAYINYSQTSLGLTYAPRSAGINVFGSLDGNAIIAVPMSGRTDVLVWTVTNGVLNPNPVIRTFPYAGGGNYFSVQPYEDGFAGIATGINFNGVNLMGSTLSESAKTTGSPTSDGKIITYKGRKYLAYVAFVNSRHVFRIVDFTGANNFSLENPIMNITGATVGNGNITVDADFKVINNKLHVLFYGTNDRLAVYRLEK
jgi:hypothetical protein